MYPHYKWGYFYFIYLFATLPPYFKGLILFILYIFTYTPLFYKANLNFLYFYAEILLIKITDHEKSI